MIEEKLDKSSVEGIYENYHAKYQGKVGLLHGKMDDEEKVSVLDQFKNGNIQILVSTTVIEVGIDIKNANLMIIYDANNFGLASLHQIRGRIGRDGSPSTCLLVHKELEDEEIEKLKILEQTLDGFKIAEADLSLRGPGDMNGLKQSGMPNFAYANIIADFKMFEIARNDATTILSNSNNPEFKDIIEKSTALANSNKFHNV